MPGLQTNSLDKVVGVYLSGVTRVPFEYAGTIYQPKEVHVSPHIFRGTTCPMGCGGCCFRFSLVWLPEDPRPDNLALEEVTVNGVRAPVYVDRQPENEGHFCKHLQRNTGLCGIHGVHPFTCDFETIRFTHQTHRVDIANRLFGRGWSYTRVTGQVGAQCDLLPASTVHRDSAVRKLKRLEQWADYFHLPTHLPAMIEWVALGPHDEPLVLRPGHLSLLDRISRGTQPREIRSAL